MDRRPVPPVRHRAGLALALILAAVAAVGCADDGPPGGEAGPAPADATTTADAQAATGAGGSPGVDRIAWSACGPDGLDCGTLTVPVDHDQPDGPTVDLALVRRPATGPAPIGTIFVNPGGPGASGVDFVRSGFGFTDDVMRRYHVVGFDPRGIGGSGTIGCTIDRSNGPLPDYSPDDEAEAAELDDDAVAFARRCGEAGAPLLAEIGTESVARDLDLLRAAVGDDVLHYYGFSYGTLIGQIYAELFPERVGHVVLDGVVDPGQTLPELLRQQTGAFDGLFGDLAAACGRLACPDGGIDAAYDRVLAGLEQAPVGEVGPAELENATLLSLYDQSLWAVYAQALTEADEGRYQTVEVLSDSFVGGVDFAAYAAVICSDSPHPQGAEGWDAFADELAGVSPRFGSAVANELRTCAYWPVPPGPAREPIRATGAAPIVVIGSTHDAATPLENAERVAADLDDGRLVVVDGTFHTSYRSSSCVRDLVADYFGDGGPPGPETRC